MKRLFSYFREHVVVRFAVIVFCLIVVLVLFAQYYFQTEYANTLEQQVIESETASMEMMSETLQMQLATYMTVLYDTATNESILKKLTPFQNGEAPSAFATAQIRDALKESTSYYNEIVVLLVTDRNGGFIGYDKSALQVTDPIWSADARNTASELYREVLYSGWPAVAYSAERYDGDPVIHIGAPIIGNSLSREEVFSVAIMTLDVGFLEEIFQRGDAQNVKSYLVDSNGFVLMCADQDLIGTPVSEQMADDTAMKMETRVNALGWTLYRVINREGLLRDTVRMSGQMNVLYLLLFFLLGVAIVIALGRFTQPLRELVVAMRDAGEGDFKVRVPVRGQDEIWKVVEKFNGMMAQLGEYDALTRRQYQQMLEAEKLQRQAEFAMLESYINSHFIFNALNAINYQALEAGNRKVSLSIKRLANIMRYAFNNRLRNVYLYQEAAWVEQYLFMQKERLGDCLSYDVFVEDTVSDWPFRKMMLQPFVENAVIHGVKQKENAVILLSAKADGPDYVVITISDNGCGMDPKTLKQVEYWLKNPKEKREGGIGICNVAERMYYFFGEGTELSVSSELEKGTVFTLRLPYPPSEKRDDGENEIEF